MENNSLFLHKKYPKLSSSLEVEAAAKRAEKQTGEKIPREKPAERIQSYLNRLKNIINPPKREGRSDFGRQARNLAMLKKMLYEKEVIKPEEVPESYFESIRQMHREEGYGEIEISDELKKELIEPIIEDQKNSLDIWVDYLASEDAKYPDYLKYWAFRSVLKMGRYDKEKEKFTERYGGTVSPFPDLNQEALSIVMDAMERKAENDVLPKENRKSLKEIIDFGFDIQEDTKQNFLKELDRKNFTKLYGIAIEEFRPISEELLKQTEGEWRVFPKGTDPQILVDTLKNHGTGWCIRGLSTAKRYLDANDLEIFYSNDEEGNPTVPRVVIVSSGNKISEVRGVEKQENMDDYIGDVVQEKLDTLPDGKSFSKKSADMKKLTAIEKKTKANQSLTKDELIFLYEINEPIEHFGYMDKDPRIEEIRKTRNVEEDMSIIFECELSQIAIGISGVNEGTKAYVGELEPGIFELIQKYNIEHIYTSFPEGKIQRWEMELGGRTKAEIFNELKKRKKSQGTEKIDVSPNVENMLARREFFTLENKEQARFIKIKIKDLGFPNGAKIGEIYKRAEKLGLELCPPETGPTMRLDYEKIFKGEQPIGESFSIAMKQIAIGWPYVFHVSRHFDGEAWLAAYFAEPVTKWRANNKIVFRLRKPADDAGK